jgi:hypothetical protein
MGNNVVLVCKYIFIVNFIILTRFSNNEVKHDIKYIIYIINIMITFITSFVFPTFFSEIKERNTENNDVFEMSPLIKDKMIDFIEWTKITPNIKYIIHVLPRSLTTSSHLKKIENIIDSLQPNDNVSFIEFDLMKDSAIFSFFMDRSADEFRHSLVDILPSQRNKEKDTFEYILNTHLKHEMIEKTINIIRCTPDNPPSLRSGDFPIYGWFDISIMEIIKNREQVSTYLNWLSSQDLLLNSSSLLRASPERSEGEDPFSGERPKEFAGKLLIPGCWPKIENVEIILNSVNWRFCGAFFLGDADSLLNFCNLHKQHFFHFFEKYNKLVWDFNFWAYLEFLTDSPEWTWYKADHNDSLFYFSSDNYVNPLSKIVEKSMCFYEKSSPSLCSGKSLNSPSLHSGEAKNIRTIEGTVFSNSPSLRSEPFLCFMRTEYNYPEIISQDSCLTSDESSSSEEKYHPMSASYMYDSVTKKHWLSTRYVNYWIHPNGNYHFYNQNHLIKNKNYISELIEFSSSIDRGSHETDTPLTCKINTFIPKYFKECNEEIDLKEYATGVSVGLEDLRLFQFSGKTKFIASSIGYNKENISNMYIGDYDLDNGVISNLKHISSPILNNRAYEKNWIPICIDRTNTDTSERSEDEKTKNVFSDENGELYFIYKWGPFQICKTVLRDLPERSEGEDQFSGERPKEFAGKLNENNEYMLNIIKTYNVTNPIFNKLRGSTTFITVQYSSLRFGESTGSQERSDDTVSVAPVNNEYLLGVAHYSEEHHPRHYYHFLILLDKMTLKPLMWSNGFCFEKLGIEFCIGFSLVDDVYNFWISRHDRDPLLMSISSSCIPLYTIDSSTEG